MYHQAFDLPRPVQPLGADPAPRPLAEPRRGVIAAIARHLRARAVRLARRQRIIREFRELDKLPDHLLRDIGMHRGEINDYRLRALLKDPATWDM